MGHITDNETSRPDSLSVTNYSRIMNRTMTDNETCDYLNRDPSVLVILHIRETVSQTPL